MIYPIAVVVIRRAVVVGVIPVERSFRRSRPSSPDLGREACRCRRGRSCIWLSDSLVSYGPFLIIGLGRGHRLTGSSSTTPRRGGRRVVRTRRC